MKIMIEAEKLEYLANILATQCRTSEWCIFNSISMCPFIDVNCMDITPSDWLKHIQNLEVSEL